MKVDGKDMRPIWFNHDSQIVQVIDQRFLPHKFIVDQAYPSEKKAYPKRSIIVMVSTAASFLFTLILLIIIDSLQARVSAIKED